MSLELRIAPDGRTLHLLGPDGWSVDLGARWLLDHADGARDPVSGQRGGGALRLDGEVRIEAVSLDGDWLEARLSGASGPCRVDLRRLRADEPGDDVELWPTPDPIEQAGAIAFQAYRRDDSVLREALSRVVRHGLARLEGAGGAPDAVERTVQRFGFIQETNYGQNFDVRIEASPNNLAFSDKGLELHADNPYRDPPPTLQLLHAITADPGGGETLFVDGFAHAEALRREFPRDFEVLARTPVRFSFTDASRARWTARAPILELAPDERLLAVRLNHRSLDLEPGDGAAMERWYDAYLAFQRRVHAPGAAFERTLRPGEIVIFDNLRILHGRRALTGGSPRWLRGCYAHRDGLQATLARLRAST